MANVTAVGAKAIHGVDPQNLVEKIVRQRIYNNQYWKEHCFGLREDDVLEKAAKLEAVGGTYGGYRKPTKFLCLLLKMLQVQPDLESVKYFVTQDDFKYVRVLGAFYLRLVGQPLAVYEMLEPILCDYRKIRMRNVDGSYTITYVDELVDRLLSETVMFDTTLPKIPSRRILEINDILQPRLSALDDSDDEDDDDDEGAMAMPPPPPPGSVPGSNADSSSAPWPPPPPGPPPSAEPESKKRKWSERTDVDGID
eukprot:Rhum_TRINITY_DN12452_c1_g2::Rhum_TRINITY_DN12452_c1_g2_i1::g.52038::m.52038/K12849/PRPF38A; pre-mRNA-splicing factor 38A